MMYIIWVLELVAWSLNVVDVVMVNVEERAAWYGIHLFIWMSMYNTW